MLTTIKCDRMQDGWNYEDCYECRHFSITVSPRNWRCKLNRDTAAEKRAFRHLWAMEYIRAHGHDLPDDEVEVIYIGKKRRKKAKSDKK
jgi:hypothetical protein